MQMLGKGLHKDSLDLPWLQDTLFAESPLNRRARLKGFVLVSKCIHCYPAGSVDVFSRWKTASYTTDWVSLHVLTGCFGPG
ncbi:unnamed protein product [Boreogadus saida]